jgi:hypothetical protein
MPSPYAAPKAVVRDPSAEPPAGWLRAKWTFFVTSIGLGIVHVPDILPGRPVSRAMLLFNLCLLAFCATMYVGRKIWLLDSRKGPLWIDVLLWALAVAGLVGVVLVRDVWGMRFNFIYVSLPVLVANATLAAVCFVAEARKHVRIFMGARNFMFLAE